MTLPKSHPDYKSYMKYHESFIEDVKARDNFKPSHLTQLDILCKMYVECEKLEELIGEMGWTYTSQGRNGFQEKIRPEVTQLNRNRSLIAAYSKMLGLLLMKDAATHEEESDNWD